jgi:hypothetical protein
MTQQAYVIHPLYALCFDIIIPTSYRQFNAIFSVVVDVRSSNGLE